MTLLQTKKSIIYLILVIFLTLLFFYLPASAAVNLFPTKDWQTTTPEAQGMRSEMLAAMMDHIQSQSLHIDSVLIVRNGYMVLDAYFWPFAKGEKHIIHSCTKSVVSALIGIAIEKGYIENVNQPIKDLLPEYLLDNLDAPKKTITLENLLMMASGLRCQDSYLYGWKGLIEMRYSPDWAQYVLGLPMELPPGEKFEYCNGVSYLLSVIIQNATNMRTLDFAHKSLFEPLGIRDIGWEASPQGVDIGWGQMRLKPHDMAKFGWLFLNKGRWGDKQIVPAKWVAISTRGHIDARLFDRYGYQWWVDTAGYYMAVGFKGQRIFVVPEKNLVAVFTGDLTGKESLVSKKLLDAYIIPAASSAGALPANQDSQVRLSALVTDVAQEPSAGFIWISKSEGVAKDGIFARTALPAFTFEYPFGSKMSGIDYPGQVMRMKTLLDIEFSANVEKIPEGIALKDFGPKVYASVLANVGSNIKVTSHKAITLKCGSQAYRTDITWLWNNTLPITTLLVSTYKDDKVVFVCAHPSRNVYTAEPIVQSLRLK